MRVSLHVNKLLSAFGLHLRRLPKSPDFPEGLGHATRGHLVELIGPTGTGKTHFHDQLLPEIRQHWLSWRQIRPLMKEMGDGKPFIELNGASSVLVNDLLGRKQRSIWALDLPVWRKVALLNHLVREMALDIRARTRIVPTAGLFSDEGITHNFAVELLHWHEECGEASCKEALHDFLQGRSIIMVDADDETILENLKCRHAVQLGNQQNDLLAFWSEETILERTRWDRRIGRRWLKLAASLGVNTLLVDLREGQDPAKEKVLRFLDDIRRAGHSANEPPQQRVGIPTPARAH